MANGLRGSLVRSLTLAVIRLDVCCVDLTRFAMDAHDDVESSDADRLPTRSQSMQISSLSSLLPCLYCRN